MAIDLSGLKVGTAWRVSSNKGYGTLMVRKVNGETCFSICYDSGGFECLTTAGFSYGAVNRIESIHHELKPVADITASDLDSLIITTKDGTRVLFADDTARLQDRSGRIHGGKACNGWQIGGNLERERDAYAAELERRRNPPVEIVWLEVLRIGDKVVAAHCCIRDDVWRISYSLGTYSIYKNIDGESNAKTVADAEQYIRDHYAIKDRATQT